MTAAVDLESVRVWAGDRVVLEVPRLTVAPGECVAIVGPNGAGKSTLLKLIGGLVDAQQGRVEVLGLSLSPDGKAAPRGRHPRASAQVRRALRRETGLLMQGLHLVPRLTARENVLIGTLGRLEGKDAWRSLLRWYPAACVQDADAALATLGLAPRADARADRLSGGERQKVALARLQLQRPRLVLADEPTSALDPAATQQVCAALMAAVAGPGQTLVTVVHDLELLPRLATRVIGLAAGRLQWDLPIDDLTPALLQGVYGTGPEMAAEALLPGPISTVRLDQV
ncbi:MAG: ATP-binding cassette domain-containing protein [Novosphingobium sp.]|nr:ATP-binding cassette domain-containing protein [Novosphingobium sp.]